MRSREASLASEVRLLREEVAGAQEAAAFAAGNAKQYQALATSSDEALRSMQVRAPCVLPRPCKLSSHPPVAATPCPCYDVHIQLC